MAALVSAVFLVVFGALLGNGLDLEPFRNPMPSHMMMPVSLGNAEKHTRDKRQTGAREMNQPLRILPIYAATVNSNLQEKASLVRDEIIPKLLDFLQQTFSVASLSGPILINNQCSTDAILRDPDTGVVMCGAQCAPTFCGAFEIPQEHLKQCIQCNTNEDTVNMEDCVIGSPSQDGVGVSGYDFVLYISANQSLCPDSQGNAQIVAFATACQNEVTQDRPIAGTINFCPAGLSNRDPNFAFAVSKHEILHALGFARFLFALWRDPETNMPRTQRDENSGLPELDEDRKFVISESTIENVVYDDWYTTSGRISHRVARLVTPAVRREARQHFQCESLRGVELENQGGSGTILNHWEKRVLGRPTEVYVLIAGVSSFRGVGMERFHCTSYWNEAMTGQVTFNPVFSRFTFAAMEDSGWYRVNYSLVDELVWGRDAGCRFAEGSCGEWLAIQSNNDQSLTPFCNTLETSDPISLRCTADHEAVSRCNLLPNLTNEPDYQYFSNSPGAGGRIFIADYCPIQDVFSFITPDGNNLRGTTCSVSTDRPPSNQLLEAYGIGSRCVLHGQQWTLNARPIPTNHGAGCYQYSCGQDQVIITIANQAFTCLCSEAGQEKEINLLVNNNRYQGSIICPVCTQICHAPSKNIVLGASGDVRTPVLPVPSRGVPMQQSTSMLLLLLTLAALSYIIYTN